MNETVIEIESAIERDDLSQIGALGHCCKPSVTALGAHPLIEIFQGLEEGGKMQSRDKVLEFHGRIAPLLKQFESEVNKLIY